MNKNKIAGAIIEVTTAIIATASNMVTVTCDINDADIPPPICSIASDISQADDANEVLAGLNQNLNKKKQNKAMANNNQALEDQIDLLDTLKEKLLVFIDQLNDLASEYEKTVDDLETSGLQHNFLSRFVDEKDEMKQQINAIIKDVEGEDIPYIKDVIDAISDLLKK